MTEDRIIEILRQELKKANMGVCGVDVEAGRRIADESYLEGFEDCQAGKTDQYAKLKT